MNVSIVIPALNEAENIQKTILHARSAGVTDIIVSDGGSDDGTPELAAAAGSQIVSGPAGRGIQMNRGAQRAIGEVLFFVHADTWPNRDCVSQIRQVLSTSSVQGGAFRQHIDADGWRYRWLERGNAWRAAWRGLPYGDQGIFLRRSFFDQLGGFPEVRLMEDLMFMQRFRRHSKPVLLDGPLYVNARRWQKHGVLRQTLRNWSLLTAFYFGVSPDKLAAYYRRHDAS